MAHDDLRADTPKATTTAPSDAPLRSDLINLADHAPIGMLRADRSGQIVYANARWREITQCDLPLPISMDALTHLVHPDDHHTTADSYIAAFKARTELELEVRIVRPSGDLRCVIVHGAPVTTADGQFDGFVGTMLDVTALRTIEAQRAAEHQRYNALLAKAAVGQAVYSLRGHMVTVNQAWADLLGYSTEEPIGTRAAHHVHPDDRAELFIRIDDLISGALPYFEQERRLIRKDGSHVWVSSSITVEHDADGNPLHFHSIVVDIDERKRAELALRENELLHRAVIESMHDGLIVHDAHGVLSANPSAARILGIDPARVLDGAHLLELEVVDTHGDPMPLDERPSMRALFHGQASHGVVQGIRGFDGVLRWCLTNAVPLFHADSDPLPYAVTLMFADITERKNAEDELRASEERFRTLTESIPVGIYRADSTGTVLYVNPRWYEISDASPTDLHQVGKMRRVHPDDLERVRQEIYATLARKEAYHGQYRLIRANGDITWVASRAACVLDPESGEITGYVGSLEDITPLVVAQEETHRLAQIIENTSDLVGIADQRTDRMSYLNRAAREQFGLVDADLSQVSDLGLFTAESAERFIGEIEPALRRGENWSGELTMASIHGEVFNVWQTMTAEIDERGAIHRISAVGRDVTEQRRRTEELAFRATHDDLTHLPNRTLLLDRLDAALAEAAASTTQVALLFVDLDRFKQVNDTLGHTAGDQLLIEAAGRISSVLRANDLVARLGGDEFVILCNGIPDEQQAVAAAHRIAGALERQPFILEGVEVSVTASIGIALSAGSVAGHEVAHAEAILRDADAAMYRAKDLGRARLEVFDENMRRRSAHRLILTDQLTIGIETGAIEVHYQPCVDLQTGRVTSVEALARWRHPERGILGPVEFIQLAEETGLIVGLGLMVLSQACVQAQAWELELGSAMPQVHVNLSARQLTASNLPDLVSGVLHDSGLTPDRLCLEITESVLMDDAETVLETLARLKRIGVTLAIDDFGTGYSSLSYLRRFPVDILKIDHSFIDGLGPDPEDSTIVEAILALAHTLDLRAIAEGVETEDQVLRLRKLGCGGAQGYYFARPAPADALTSVIAKGFVL